MDKKEAAKRMGLHHSMIQDLKEYSWKEDSTTDVLKAHLSEILRKKEKSLDALIFPGKVDLTVWHRDQKFACSSVGVPIAKFVLDDYVLKASRTNSTGGRFGTALSSYFVLNGSDSSKSHKLELAPNATEAPQASSGSAYTWGVTVQSREGIILMIHPRTYPENQPIFTVEAVSRKKAHVVFDDWFTKALYQGIDLELEESRYECEVNPCVPGIQNKAVLQNGWSITDKTTYLPSYNEPESSFIPKKTILIERNGRKPFHFRVVRDFVEQMPQVKSWCFNAYDVAADGLELREGMSIRPLDEWERNKLQLEEFCNFSRGYTKEGYQRLMRKKFSNGGWDNVNSISIKLNVHEDLIPKVNEFIKYLADS